MAAMKVFARKGLAATKMADIAGEAEISYGLLYHYFDNKELLFKAAVELGTRSFERLINQAQGQIGSPWERILYLTNTILDGMRRVPEGFLVANQAFVSDSIPPDIREMAREQSRQAMQIFEDIVIEGQRLGQVVAGNPTELTVLYFACIGGMAHSLAYVGIPEANYPRSETLLRLLRP